MSRARFIAIVPDTTDARHRWLDRLRAVPESLPGAHWALDCAKLLVMGFGTPGRRIGEDAVVMGSLFERSGAAAQMELAGCGGPGVAQLAGQLAREYWGGYVLLQQDRADGTASAFRAPLGDLPCFFLRQDDAIILGSDLAMIIAAGVAKPVIEPLALARYLAREDLLTTETCLEAVAELRGGERIIFRGKDHRQETLWTPWSFTSQSSGIAEEQRLRDLAISSTNALATGKDHIVLKLSGGLDSSIVAACLKETRKPFTAVNLVTGDPAGDERHHARLVCARLDVPLVEAYRNAEQVSVNRSAAARLPRPSARSFAQETARICAKAANSAGDCAIFDGGGGDNVFCSLQSARLASDCLKLGGPGRQFWRVTADVAEIAQASIWQVAKQAWAICRRPSPAYRWPVDLRFLSAGAMAVVPPEHEHPWLLAPRGALPGAAAHVALLAAAQSVIEGFDPAETISTYSPLIVQPVVEACLAIPSWRWVESGRNRAAARRAFSALLPEATLARRSKGAPDSFIADVYERNRGTIRTMLMEGFLASHGLLDRDTVIAALDGAGPLRGHDYLRLMRLADVEAWAAAWS